MIKDILGGLRYGISKNKALVFSAWISKWLYNLAPLAFAVVWASLIDTAVKGIQANNLTLQLMLVPFLLYAFIELAKSIFNRLQHYFETRAYDELEEKVHTDVLAKYSSLDIPSLEDSEVNRLFQVLRESYEWRIRVLVFTVGSVLSSFILITISSVILFKISPLVLVVTLVSAIPSLIFNMKFSAVDWGIWHENADKFRKFTLTREFLLNKENLIEAKINNIASYLVNVIREILRGYHKKRIPMLKKRALMMSLADLIRVIGAVISVYLLINGTLLGTISIGSLILASSIFISFSGNLGSLLYDVSEAFNSAPFMKDFVAFMNLKPKIENGNIKIPQYVVPPKIEFKNVSFKYPNTDRLILKDIDLTIEPGMKVALVGENGVGKTTLIKILSRFYDLNGGEILIEGQNLQDIQTESWERNLGLLTQHFNKFTAFNVEDNIYFGDVSKNFDKEKILKSAEKAQVTSFVNKYPKGLKQLLSIQFDDGIDPSWGQWQRIGIARTLYRNSPIIILDEPTSAIDAQAEYEIFQNLNEHTKGKTVIYVSHRYSTVRNADLICVLKEGKIIESGNHNELLSLDGEYAKNFRLQAKGYN